MAHNPIHDGTHYALQFLSGNKHAWQDFKDVRAREKGAKARLKANREAKDTGGLLPHPGSNRGARVVTGTRGPAGSVMPGITSRAVPGFQQPSRVQPATGQGISQQLRQNYANSLRGGIGAPEPVTMHQIHTSAPFPSPPRTGGTGIQPYQGSQYHQSNHQNQEQISSPAQRQLAKEKNSQQAGLLPTQQSVYQSPVQRFATAQQTAYQQLPDGGIPPAQMPLIPSSHQYQRLSLVTEPILHPQVVVGASQPNHRVPGPQSVSQPLIVGGTYLQNSGPLFQNYPQYALPAFANARQSTRTGYPSLMTPHLSMPKVPLGIPNPTALKMAPPDRVPSADLGANIPPISARMISASGNSNKPQDRRSQQPLNDHTVSVALPPPATYYQTSKSQSRHGVSSSQQQRERLRQQEQQEQEDNKQQGQAIQPQQRRKVQKNRSDMSKSKPPQVMRSNTEVQENEGGYASNVKPPLVRRSQTEPHGYIGVSGPRNSNVVNQPQGKSITVSVSRTPISQAHTTAQQRPVQRGIIGSVAPGENQIIPNLRSPTAEQAQKIEAIIPGSAPEAIVERMNEIRKATSKKNIPGSRYVPVQHAPSTTGPKLPEVGKALIADSPISKNGRSHVEGVLPSSAVPSVIKTLKGPSDAADHKNIPKPAYVQSIPDMAPQELGRVPTKDAQVGNNIRSMVEAMVPKPEAPSIFKGKSERLIQSIPDMSPPELDRIPTRDAQVGNNVRSMVEAMVPHSEAPSIFKEEPKILVQSVPDWTPRLSQRDTTRDFGIGDNARTFVEAMIPGSQVPEELQIQPLVQSVPDWTPPGSVYKIATKDARIGENNRSFIEAMIPASEADPMFRNQAEYQKAVTAPVLVQSVKDWSRPASQGRVRTEVAKIGDMRRTFVEGIVPSKEGRKIEKQKNEGNGFLAQRLPFGNKPQLGIGKRMKRLGEK